jgi:hypothetical protein
VEDAPGADAGFRVVGLGSKFSLADSKCHYSRAAFAARNELIILPQTTLEEAEDFSLSMMKALMGGHAPVSGDLVPTDWLRQSGFCRPVANGPGQNT